MRKKREVLTRGARFNNTTGMYENQGCSVCRKTYASGSSTAMTDQGAQLVSACASGSSTTTTTEHGTQLNSSSVSGSSTAMTEYETQLGSTPTSGSSTAMTECATRVETTAANASHQLLAEVSLRGISKPSQQPGSSHKSSSTLPPPILDANTRTAQQRCSFNTRAESN